MSGRAGGMGGGMGRAKAQVHFGKAPQLAVAEGRDEAARGTQAKVRQIGTKTFYFKNQRWVDSTITPEEESKSTVIVQFSDAYFNLAGTQNTEYNKYLSLPEPITVKLDGKVYQIDPVKQESAR
jgi:hypothetical protein